MRLPLLLATLLSVAGVLMPGCLEGGEEPSTTDEGEPLEGEDRTSRRGRVGEDGDGEDGGHYADRFGLTLNPDGMVAVSVGGVTSGNCVVFWDTSGADYTILNGTVTMEWAALTPLAETLALYGDGIAAEGTSPLVVELADIDAEGWGVVFAGDMPFGSLAVQQPFTLAFDFTYDGDLPSPGIGSCSNGIP